MKKEILDNFEKELKPKREHDKPGGPLFHYTDANGLIGIIENKCIWATHYLFLNDRKELEIGEKCFREEAELLMKDPLLSERRQYLLGLLIKTYEQAPLTRVFDIYIASFSEEPDQLSQWRGYVPRGGGFSIGIKAYMPSDKKRLIDL